MTPKIQQEPTQISTKDIKHYILAGRSIFTIHSAKINKRFTYRIRVDQSNSERFFVHLFYGDDNENPNNYRFLGWFYTDNFTLRHSTKSAVQSTSDPFRMLSQFLSIVQQEQELPDTCNLYLSTHCARCGHLLTTPESIQRGLGPECATHSV